MSLPLHPAPESCPATEVLAVNLFAAGPSVVLVAPLPGVMAEHVQVVVTDGQLHVRAERDVDGDHDYLLHEWPATALERTVELPDDAGWPITAAVAHGQLTVTLARRGTRPQGESLTVVPPAESHPARDDVPDVIDLRRLLSET